MRRRKCKKVLIIDATDYPLIRVVRPFSPVGISGDKLLTGIKWELRTHLWCFYDFDYVDVSPIRFMSLSDQAKSDKMRHRA